MTTQDLISTLGAADVYDLGQPYFVGIPRHPNHPPYLYSMTKRHGDVVTPNGTSSAAESIALGTHVGTHLDALCHFSCGGVLFGGHKVAELQSTTGGMRMHSVDHVKPMLRRGVLLDIAGQQGVRALPKEFAITPEMFERAEREQGVTVRAGDVVLIRTGWANYWTDDELYLRQVEPGPELPGGEWLSARKVFAAGSDTICFERVPSPNMPVHVHLLVENGIHIIEALNMEELARARVYEFLFVAVPMKIQGGTGAPVRPLAVVAKG